MNSTPDGIFGIDSSVTAVLGYQGIICPNIQVRTKKQITMTTTNKRNTEVNIDDTLNDLGGKRVPIIIVAISGNEISPNIITPIIILQSPE